MVVKYRVGIQNVPVDIRWIIDFYQFRKNTLIPLSPGFIEVYQCGMYRKSYYYEYKASLYRYDMTSRRITARYIMIITNYYDLLTPVYDWLNNVQYVSPTAKGITTDILVYS